MILAERSPGPEVVIIGHGPDLPNVAHPNGFYSGPPGGGYFQIPYIVDGVLVYVDDVQAHFERAKAAGARILSEPEEGPRRYRVEDLEGHRWYFMER